MVDSTTLCERAANVDAYDEKRMDAVSGFNLHSPRKSKTPADVRATPAGD
jgi:hypothetical protein